ncbi:MAG: hypothetical protein LUF84_06720 [Clostridiales bacterium]|nr:hypothetical protein [Clostridiales bacterium]
MRKKQQKNGKNLTDFAKKNKGTVRISEIVSAVGGTLCKPAPLRGQKAAPGPEAAKNVPVRVKKTAPAPKMTFCKGKKPKMQFNLDKW